MAIGRTIRPTQEAISERAFLKLGAVCAVLGAAAFLVAGGLHGDLPHDADAAARYLAARPYWSAVHLLAIIAALLWVPAFAGLAKLIARRDELGPRPTRGRQRDDRRSRVHRRLLN